MPTYVITVPECYRQTDRQTDRQTTYCCITALCVASRGKNEPAPIWRVDAGDMRCKQTYLQEVSVTWPSLWGATTKSNPLSCFANISTKNRNFYEKIYAVICHSYLRI